jgi:uncharacterized membrane protein
LAKTKSINERYVYAYLPSVEVVRNWKARAKKSKISISQFVFEHVTNSLRQEDGEESFRSRAELIDELHLSDEALKKLTREKEITNLALERVESELKRYRSEPFLQENFRGLRKYDLKLIEILKKGPAVDSDELLPQLRISPRETDRVRAVSKQLENLEAYGLVEKTRRGWKWV